MQTPPLADVRVLDFSQNLPGPYATHLMNAWGANVIKVEPPKGDPARFMEPMFSMINRGKRSVVLDLRDESDRRRADSLLRWADVIVDGFRPGVMKRLGCDYEKAFELNPRVIYLSISAFGQRGPLAQHPGHDLNLQAISGVSHLERDGFGVPGVSALPIADLSSSLVALAAVCGALNQPTRGTHIDVAMADAVVSWSQIWGVGLDFSATAARAAKRARAPASLSGPLSAWLDRVKLFGLPHYGLFRCADRKWLCIGIVDENHFWRSLCAELSLGRLARLPMSARLALGPLLRPLVAARVRRRPLAHWIQRGQELGLPLTPVRAPGEALREPQLGRRALSPDGALLAPLPFARSSSSSAPELGQHTDEVFAELGQL